MGLLFASYDTALSVGVKNAQCSGFMDIGHSFRTDQQASLIHRNTQLSKILSTVAERLGSVKHISTVITV